MREVTLEEQKKLMLDLLIDFDSFCRSHHLRYYLTGGTLLGAVRHHGYIPWDDDIDVGLPRYDYEQFCRLYNKEKTNADYVFLSYHDEPQLYVSSGKLYDSRTVMEEAADSPVKIGVYLDVFPLDNIGSTKEEAEQFTTEALKYRKRLTVRTWKVNVKGRPLYKDAAVALIKLGSTKKPVSQLVREQDAFCSQKMSEELSPFVGYVCAAMKQEILQGKWFEKTVSMPFEGHEMQIPQNYKEVLTVFYGSDYMQLPPEEKRISHHSYKVGYKD